MSLALTPGLCSVTFRGLAPEEVAALAAEAGLGAIEWAGDAHAPPGDLAAARRCAAACAAAGLRAVSYGSYVEAGAPGAAIGPALASARAMGVRHCRVWAGRRGVGAAAATAAAIEDCAAFLRAAAGQAAAEGMSLSVEFHPNTLTDTVPAALAIQAQAAAPNLYTLWQPDFARDDAAAAAAAVRALADPLSHLHVFAWRPDKRRLPLAEGAALWQAALAALRPGRWQGERFAFLEFVERDAPAALLRDAAVLRAWLGQDRAPNG
ncbi:TIM barrel protein [Falsiroseomonas tokyonensis]|uniref:TIM barrel protein n=1 Tax=Falsiroseomonas tokyonensis TaxID=430521 RepID=A0ABV7BVM4_9PROT|nr:TIM barrel protein [Falsiroseomonas tokyonensis]MBU8538667.1 TIM barrel protein [Falsiroseomonas tokyonensis]